MDKRFSGKGRAGKCLTILLSWFLLLMAGAHAEDKTPLRLERTIPLPDVQGRIDHLAMDLSGERLFVAALGNKPSKLSI